MRRNKKIEKIYRVNPSRFRKRLAKDVECKDFNHVPAV